MNAKRNAAKHEQPSVHSYISICVGHVG